MSEELELKNNTPSTATASQSSPALVIEGTFWNGTASLEDSWSIQDDIGNGTNGTSLLYFNHTGTSGQANVGFSTPILVPGGSPSTPGFGFFGVASGLYAHDSLVPAIVSQGLDVISFYSNGVAGSEVLKFVSTTRLAWGVTGLDSTEDTGISRIAAGIVGISGSSGNTSGKLSLSHINVSGLAVYLSNALAIAGGLAAGDLYRMGIDPDVVCVVH